MKVVCLKFDNDTNLYYYNCNNIKLKENIMVIADTLRGYQFGKVISFFDDYDNDVNNNYNIIRVANKKDYSQYSSNVNDAKYAVSKCKSIIDKLGLSMSIIDANYNFDRSQLLFRFI